MALAIAVLLILEWFRRDRLPPCAFGLGQAVTLADAGCSSGFQRVASGGHFLSDVLLSWLFTALIAVVLAKLLLVRRRGARPAAT